MSCQPQLNRTLFTVISTIRFGRFVIRVRGFDLQSLWARVSRAVTVVQPRASPRCVAQPVPGIAGELHVAVDRHEREQARAEKGETKVVEREDVRVRGGVVVESRSRA